jgi:hypothetical protein
LWVLVLVLVEGEVRDGAEADADLVAVGAERLPLRSVNGTPAQRQLSTNSVTAAKVSVRRSGSTPGSST